MKNKKSQQDLIKKVEKLASQVRQQYLNSIKSLAIALEARDRFTQCHSLRVTLYSLAAAELLAFPREKMEKLHLAGLLHDIGKIGVQEEILHHPDELSKAQHEQIRIHPLLSTKIVRPTISDEEILSMIRHHHEHWDGSGYPDGLKGEKIPLGACIMRVCDTFDAMTSSRPYREAWPMEIALVELKRLSGSQLDPNAIEAFLKIPEEKLKEIQNLPFRSLLSDLYEDRDEEIDIFSIAFIT